MIEISAEIVCSCGVRADTKARLFPPLPRVDVRLPAGWKARRWVPGGSDVGGDPGARR